MASPSLNNASTAHPGFGSSYAVNGLTEIQANSIGQDNLRADVLQRATVVLTAAQVQGMFAAPVQIVPAPAAGTSIIVNTAMIRVNSTGATAFAGGGVTGIQFGSTVHGAGTQAFATIAAASINSATNLDTQLGDAGANIVLPQATGLFFSNATGAFTTGTGTVEVDVWYAVK